MPKSNSNQNGSSGRIRYAVVGLGWIAQEVILPGFKGAKNSELVALFSDDAEKLQELGQKYNVEDTLNYSQYDEFLRSGKVDAVYITVPNNLHKDYTLRAAQAGVHVLCEKPMADNVAECEEMIRAAQQNNVKLMIAYRLHFEPANLHAVELAQSGKLGDLRIFSSVFSQQVPQGNVRLKKSSGGGPLMDMGVYPINAARYLFREEPLEVTAVGANSGDPRFTEVHEMVSAVLRFPQDKLAVLTCSFGAAPVDSYQLLGTKGELLLEPAFDYHTNPKLRLKIADDEDKKKFDKVDQFGGEVEYFSRCILEDQEPEPSGQEGLADIRIVEALLESMRTRQPVQLPPFQKEARPGEEQAMHKRAVKPVKDLVNAQSASGQ